MVKIDIREERFAMWELKTLITQLVINTSWVCGSSLLYFDFGWSPTKAEKDDLGVAIENQRPEVVCVVILLSVAKMLEVLSCIKDNKIKSCFCCRM